MKVENKDLIGRFDNLHSERNVIQQTWDAIRVYITPYRGHFFRDQQNESSIEWSQRHIFDSTAIIAHKTLSSTLHSGLTSPTIKWFELRFRDEALNKSNSANRWIQEVSDRTFYELQDSNFNLEIAETYQDITGFGTSFLTLEEDNPDVSAWTGLDFGSVPLKEGHFEPDSKGRILRFYRLLKMTPQQIIAKFGDAVPQSVKDKEKGNNTDRMEVLFVIFPRKNDLRPTSIKDWNTTLSPSKRPYQFRYILKAEAATLGKQGGYYEMPTFAPRWETTSESVWGNSPAMLALGDVLTLNEAREMQLRMAEKMIDPPIMATERAVISDLDMSAGAVNTVRTLDEIESFDSKGDFPVSDAMIEQLQNAVRNYFFVDQLQFPAPQAQPMTATEAQIRYEIMQRLMATAMGRIRNDMLDPIIGRTVRMLARKGQLPEAPAAVLEKDAQLDIIYMGSIARAQRIDEAAAIERLVGFAGSLAEVYQGREEDPLDSIDINEAVNYTGRGLNVPAVVLRDENEVKRKQDERKQEQALMKQAAAAQATGEGQQALAAGEQAQVAAGEENVQNARP